MQITLIDMIKIRWFHNLIITLSYYHIITFIFFVLSLSLYSQNNSVDSTVADYQFQKARKLAFNSKRAEARRICRQILKNHPDYADVRILMGRTYEWDNKPDSARLELKKVISKGYYEDAYSAMLDVETWENRPDSAMLYVDVLLMHNPNNTDYLIKKAKLLQKKGDDKGAALLLNQILANIDPANKQAKDMLVGIRFAKALNRIAAGWNNEYFDKSSISNSNWTRNWNVYSIEYSRWFVPFGLIQFRTDLGTLNNDKLVNKQFDLDAYPGITKHDYLWIDYGYSPDDDNFPRHHAGLELFHSFPHAFEASLGFRYLQFHSSSGVSDVLIYTGSVGKYIGNYWFDLRVYITPSRDLQNLTNNTYQEFSKSFYLTVRKYFATSNDYLSLAIGAGSSPIRYTNIENFYVSNTQAIIFGYQRVIS